MALGSLRSGRWNDVCVAALILEGTTNLGPGCGLGLFAVLAFLPRCSFSAPLVWLLASCGTECIQGIGFEFARWREVGPAS